LVGGERQDGASHLKKNEKLEKVEPTEQKTLLKNHPFKGSREREDGSKPPRILFGRGREGINTERGVNGNQARNENMARLRNKICRTAYPLKRSKILSSGGS